jgi:hypothetical protein
MRWLRVQTTRDCEVRQTRRDRHAVRPELEGCERRLLLASSSGSITWENAVGSSSLVTGGLGNILQGALTQSSDVTATGGTVVAAGLGGLNILDTSALSEPEGGEVDAQLRFEGPTSIIGYSFGDGGVTEYQVNMQVTFVLDN